MPTTQNIPSGFDLLTGAELYNTKTKIYPDGKKNIIYSNRQIFHPEIEKEDIDEEGKEEDCEVRGSAKDDKMDDGTDTGTDAGTESDAVSVIRDDVLKRNRERVFDIVYCNKWDWFLTITFDPALVDSSNVGIVMSKLSRWLSNKVQRQDLRYILVPEKFHHSDGIHCHALINDAVDTTYSGRIRIGKKSVPEEICKQKRIAYSDADKIFNVDDWKYGFSTALPISDNSGKLSVYLTKYITKGNDRIFGRYYWSSRNLVREPYIEYSNTPYDEIDLPEFEVPGTGYKVKYEQRMDYIVGV